MQTKIENALSVSCAICIYMLFCILKVWSQADLCISVMELKYSWYIFVVVPSVSSFTGYAKLCFVFRWSSSNFFSSFFSFFFSSYPCVASFWKEIRTLFTIGKFVLILKQQVSVTSFSQEMQFVQLICLYLYFPVVAFESLSRWWLHLADAPFPQICEK